MKILKTYNIIAVTLLVVTLLSACHRTELCYDHYPRATFKFDWEQEWERDYGMAHQVSWDAGYHGFDYDLLRPATPEWLNLVKYKSNQPNGEHYLKPGGGDIVFKEGGSHTFLVYNGDTEYIILSDIASLNDARGSASSRSRAGLLYINERHPNVRSTNPPDILYAAYVDDAPTFNIHQHHYINVKMQPLVYTYVIRYEFEYGLEYVSLARGALGGMAESVYLRDGRTSETPSVILYDCDVKSYGCEAHVHSFGVPAFPDEYYGRSADDATDRPFSLNLEVLLKNGTTLEFNYDITDQIKNQPRGGVITVSGIRVEDQIGKSDSGFNVDVTDWPEHDVIDLPIEVEP